MEVILTMLGNRINHMTTSEPKSRYQKFKKKKVLYNRACSSFNQNLKNGSAKNILSKEYHYFTRFEKSIDKIIALTEYVQEEASFAHANIC